MKRVRVASKEAVRWGVVSAAKKAEKIGYVKATDPEAAIELSFEELKVAPSDRWRISVQREA